MSNTENGFKIPADTKYTEDHEWISIVENNLAVCGISDHAQHSLGDIVFVEFINNILNVDVNQKDSVAIVESPKAASDVYSPVTGKIVEVNNDIEDSPELINTDPYGEGWLFKIEIKDMSEYEDLMGPDEYMEYIKEEE